MCFHGYLVALESENPISWYKILRKTVFLILPQNAVEMLGSRWVLDEAI